MTDTKARIFFRALLTCYGASYECSIPEIFVINNSLYFKVNEIN